MATNLPKQPVTPKPDLRKLNEKLTKLAKSSVLPQTNFKVDAGHVTLTFTK